MLGLFGKKATKVQPKLNGLIDMAQDKDLQGYILERLDKPVPVKGGATLKDPLDGHEMTVTEAIAYRMTEKALAGDVKAAQFIMQLEAQQRLQNKRK